MATWVSLQHGGWFLPEQVIQERGSWKRQCLSDSLGHTWSCVQYPTGYTGQPYSVWQGTAQECEYQEVGILEVGSSSQLLDWKILQLTICF